ncbi:MAG: heavy metal-binding domain-containing protein [Desulfobacterales bacterium]
MSIAVCPNCQAAIKKGVFRENELLNKKKIRIINEYTDNASKAYCNKCGDFLYTLAKEKIQEKIASINSSLEEKAKHIVILTTHIPIGWDYRALGIVTAQTTTGTGVLAEFTSEFTDFFGAQSGAYNKKLAEGENSCFSQIGMKTLGLGGNAVIAADIDYTEVGGLKGMLMVCMAGTAVALKNTEILGSEKAKELNDIDSMIAMLHKLKGDLD